MCSSEILCKLHKTCKDQALSQSLSLSTCTLEQSCQRQAKPRATSQESVRLTVKTSMRGGLEIGACWGPLADALLPQGALSLTQTAMVRFS